MKFNQRKYKKALESILFLAQRDTRSYWVLKAIYFADKLHLSRYGRQIFGDSYRAMKFGPVPSLAYDILKDVRGIGGWYTFTNPSPEEVLDAPDERTVIPKREPNLSLLSETDMDCLIEAHNAIKDLSFRKVEARSHDNAYNSVEQDDDMSIESIVNTLDNGEEVLAYLFSE